MPYRALGQCGVKVSTFALGGWTTFGGSVTDPKVIHQILHHAYGVGVNFFDMADIYAKGETEKVMGQVLKEFPRHTLVLSSKVFWPMSEDVNDRGLSRKHIMESVEKSLKRLGTDYLDLYFCHRYDEATPLEETVRAMDDLVHQGKVLYWGTSEWTAEQITASVELCKSRGYYRPKVEQPQYSLVARNKVEPGVRQAVKAAGMGMVVWSPLGSGILTGKYDEGIPKGSRLDQIPWLREMVLTDGNIERVRQFKTLAKEAGCSRAQLALAWVAAQPNVSSVILGATQLTQLQENLGALNISMTQELASKIEAIFS
ncbi:MAG: aldo/keto reductase family protein [Deltaproteobacteria bacterium]|nr:aldo/keto reductase family protein [Deltaproteobacteria bacterium]